MKILIINDYGIEIGGAETYLKNYKKSLRGLGHDVRVLTSNSPEGIATFSDYTYKRLNVKSLSRVFPYLFNIDAFVQLKKIIKDFKPDIVHLHSIFYHTSPSVLLALKDIPTVMTLHAQEIIAPVGLNFSEKCNHPFIGYCMKCTGVLKYYPEKIKRYFFKLLSRRINYFISPSKYYVAIHKKAGFDPVQCVYNGIEEKKVYKPIDANCQNLLFVGRLAIEKGAEYPIRALPLIHKKHPSATLTIVGDGPDYARLKRLIAELNLSKYVTMVGKVPNKETASYYEQTSIVVVPSTYPDNLPTVCIEAMHNGRIIIASNNGGLPELVNDGVNGYLVRAGNYQDIAENAIKVFSNKELLIRMSQNSRIMISKFTITKNTENVVSLYNKILKK